MTYPRAALYYNHLWLSPLNSTAIFSWTHPSCQAYTESMVNSSLAKCSLTCWHKSSSLQHNNDLHLSIKGISSETGAPRPSTAYALLVRESSQQGWWQPLRRPIPTITNNLEWELSESHLGSPCVSTLDWELSPRVNLMSSEYKEWMTEPEASQRSPHQTGGIYHTLWISVRGQNR